ncbi:general transcription factor 3C polypeptide 5 [Anopheles nili]|uniref:general transcription factor 3C polypeptide 5 n=1 Tax=Anopheles nili TaxID=185578 RepID=UPI00237C357E|nr:general transcription factor 3C polypeptide 5 [Anopheles nili]
MEYSSKTAHEHRFDRDLICIEYPGVVLNPERMIESLGGIREISTTFGQDKRRLELRFRPDCIYAKPAFGDGAPSTGLLLKVIVRRKKSQPNDATVRLVQIMGCVKRLYKFDSLCDFQQLPAFRSQTSGKVENFHDEIVPQGVCTMSPFDKSPNIPFFLPPVSFSRADQINNNVLRETKCHKVAATDHSYRRRRKKHGIYHPFTLTEPIPDKPSIQAQNMIDEKLTSSEDVEKIRCAFKTRPIWTRNALISVNRIMMSKQLFGIILPTIAYYYVNGPWRGTWVRYGYDPRKHFESRVYQMLDFRVRSIGSLHECIKIKRLSVSKANYRLADSASSSKDGQRSFVNSSFDEDTIPPHRVVLYQYCDIHLKKIQEMLKKVPSPKSGTVCDERNGWLPYRFDDQCRNIMMEVLLNNIRKLRAENPEVCSGMESVDDEDGEGISDFDEEEDPEMEDITDSMDDVTD